MDLPGDGSTGNLASARHEAGDVIVASAVKMGGRGEGGVHARTGDASGHCEGGTDLHEISISGEDSRHEKKSTDDFGDVRFSKYVHVCILFLKRLVVEEFL